MSAVKYLEGTKVVDNVLLTQKLRKFWKILLKFFKRLGCFIDNLMALVAIS